MNRIFWDTQNVQGVYSYSFMTLSRLYNFFLVPFQMIFWMLSFYFFFWVFYENIFNDGDYFQ